MYDRLFNLQKEQHVFIFGPRGVGKTSWLKSHFPQAPYFDLLDAEVYFDLSRKPSSILDRINPHYSGPVIIDEVQKLPALLDEIHRIIESKNSKIYFILTGSSARKLKRSGVNLLAGRAHVYHFYPLTAEEIGTEFQLKKALKLGMLPSCWSRVSGGNYLKSYITTYLEQEIKLEGLTRNIYSFQKFLEAASFSQGAPLNISAVASDCGVERRTVTNYFEILNDLLISYELTLFTKRAKRELIKHRKFYFFDAGLFRNLRPTGPLDSESELNGLVFETLVLQEIKALNEYFRWGYQIYYWHTKKHDEVDFILYGKKGFFAIEVKSSSRIKDKDFEGLELFMHDYPESKGMLIYGGEKQYWNNKIEVIPANVFFKNVKNLF